MPLIKATLQAQILSILQEQVQKTDNQEQAMNEFAEKLATAIDTYIKTATVTTTAPCTAGGAVGTGTLS